MKYNVGTVGLAQKIKQRLSSIVTFKKSKKVSLVSVGSCCHNEY